MPPETDNDMSARREEARLAMEGEERRAKRAVEIEAMGSRRAEAAKAMESPAHRARREARERAVREATQSVEAKAVAERAVADASAQATTEAIAREEALANAKQVSDTTRVNVARQATAEISNLKNIPTHLSSIRTLKTDMAEAVNQGGSMAGALMAQGGQNTIGSRAPAHRSRALTKTIFVLILLGALAVGGTLAYKKWLAVLPPNSQGGTASTTPITVRSSLVFAENKTDLDIVDKDIPTLITKIRELRANNQTPQTIGEITFRRGGTPLIFRLWQAHLELPFTDNLTRMIEPTFMFGFYRSATHSEPFIILKTKTPDQIFPQLITWEKSLPLVWDKIIGKPPVAPVNINASSTAIINPRFQDQVIQNLDTRILEGEGVAQPAMYGFLDPQTIILTQTRATFTEILTRFRKGIN